jgi:putative tryptophan/tyrosine transport system substrate-binding protein
MRRRKFITLLGSAVAVAPAVASAQQIAMPLIGWLESGGPVPPVESAAFRQGLSEMGYVEGRNVTIEFVEAHGQYDQLPALTAELVSRKPAVIYAANTANAAQVAKTATAAIPIVFANGSDPVKLNLIKSLNRPGGNVTGVTFYAGELVAKRLELLRELVPDAKIIGLLTNPTNLISETDVTDVRKAARAIGQQLKVFTATTVDELDLAFEAASQAGVQALLLDVDNLFNRRRDQIVARAAKYKMPANYPTRVFAEAGGLMSYGDNRAASIRQAGIYVGRILMGEKPAELPIVQPSKFEFVINLKTAKALGLTFPSSFYLRADEVIE